MILAPRLWLGHLLVVLAVAAATALGLWQFAAYQAQQDAEARNLMGRPAIAFTDVIGPDDPFPGTEVGQPVTLSGTWIPDGTVIIDRDGRRWLAEPLMVDSPTGSGDGSALYVVLGSLASDDPGAAAIEDQVMTGRSPEITGWLQPPEGTGVYDDDASDNVLPQMRIADLVQQVDLDLYSAFVIAREPLGTEPGVLAGVHPDQLPKADSSTGLRNLMYGVEWWIFGAFAIFIWWMWVKEMLAPQDEDEAPRTEERSLTSETVGSQP
ncbi:MAG: SURF1 family cytochrome oxidase biogenesis protein [Nocardioides sp.]